MATFGAKAPDVDFEVKWYPFELDSALPPRKNKLASYKAKFGEARVAEMLPQMVATGRAHGIAFSYGGDIGNTFDSHRLVAWATRSHGLRAANELMEQLFRRYFELEQNLAERDVLLSAAAEAGLDGEGAAAAFLDGPADAEAAEVRAEMRTMRETHQIGGVPHFIVGGKLSFSGAQESATIVSCFERVVQEE